MIVSGSFVGYGDPSANQVLEMIKVLKVAKVRERSAKVREGPRRSAIGPREVREGPREVRECSRRSAKVREGPRRSVKQRLIQSCTNILFGACVRG
jgi:hypothetical protein